MDEPHGGVGQPPRLLHELHVAREFLDIPEVGPHVDVVAPGLGDPVDQLLGSQGVLNGVGRVCLGAPLDEHGEAPEDGEAHLSREGPEYPVLHH